MGGRGGGSPAGRGATADWRSQVDMVQEIKFGVDFSFPQPRTMPDVPLARLEQAMALMEKLFGDNEFHRLPAVRDALSRGGFSLGEQDKALERMVLTRRGNLVPIANLKSLSNEDRRAAVFVGGEQKTAIIIER